jgi:perosamine synthetase
MIDDRILRRPAGFERDDVAELGHLVPEPEPQLHAPPPHPDGSSRRILPVSETSLGEREVGYVASCVRENWISSAGSYLRRFEAAFAERVGSPHAVACSSGTAALHLLLASLELGPEDEVILPAFTMIAVANTVVHAGGAPVLVDVERDTGNLDPAAVAARVGPRTRGIVAVHTYGHPADLDALGAIAERHGLFLFEDCAEAHGARWRGRPVGALADAGTFSFYGNKILSTGEGGMVTTRDERLARLTRQLRDHAFSEDRHFWHRYVGFNFRMTNLQAAVGLAQTERFEELVGARRRNRGRYDEALRAVPGLRLPVERPGAHSVFWMYGLVVEDEFGISRDELRRRLARRGVETRSYFVPLHAQPAHRGRFRGQRFPVSEDLGRRGLYLPSSARLTDDEIAYVAAAVADARERP